MEIDEIITIQSPQWVMLPIVHLQDEVDPAQVPLPLINLSHDAIQIDKCTVIGTLQLYVDYQEL